jgi:arylsulfatase A-like enzyme
LPFSTELTGMKRKGIVRQLRKQPPSAERARIPTRQWSSGPLVLAIWFALLTGFAELCFLAVRVTFYGQVLPGSANPHLPWLTFLAEFVVFGTIGIAVFLIGWRWPRLAPLRVVAFLLALPCVFSLRAFFSETPWYAWAVLNVGAALGVAQLLGFRPKWTFAVARWSLLVLVPGAAAVCLNVYLDAALDERRALANLPPAVPGTPNVLLIVLDTVRAESMSLHGYGRATTPRLEEWARRGVCFDRAVAPSSWTVPSHATYFTGHMPHEIFNDWERMSNNPWQLPMDDRFPTLAELLNREGYRTAGFVANWHYLDRVWGLNRGFAHYEDQLVFAKWGICFKQILNSSYLTRQVATAWESKGHDEPDPSENEAERARQANPQWLKIVQAMTLTDVVPLARKDATEVNREFLEWLPSDRERPFFAFLNYMDAHSPYIHRPEYRRQLTSSRPATLPGRERGDWLIEQLAPLREDYESSLAYLDHHIGALLDELERRKLLQSTLVIITSDHGEQFGEHGTVGHGNSLFMQLLHVPLIVLYPPSVPAGLRVSEAVSLANLPATILDVLRLRTDALPGKSLARFWAARAPSGPTSEPVYSDLDVIVSNPEYVVNLRSVVEEGHHYILNRYDGWKGLYQWPADIDEKYNLIASKDQHGLINRLNKLLRQYEDGGHN